MEFGRALLKRALSGKNVRLVPEQVTGIAETAGGWRLHTAKGQTYAADYLVGADGVQSIVRRHVVGPIPRQHLALAVGYTMHAAPNALTFQTYADLEGYLWCFPRSDHASVGIATRLTEAQSGDPWKRLDAYLDDACPEAKRERRWAAVLPMARDASLWDTPCVGSNWALLGDAAGQVHPITGEGVAYALWSAELLGQALRRGDRQAYDSLWRQAYGHCLTSASEAIRRTGSMTGVFEIMLQLALMTAVPSRPG
jgi:flavin-dependent dehydrogenase